MEFPQWLSWSSSFDHEKVIICDQRRLLNSVRFIVATFSLMGLPMFRISSRVSWNSLSVVGLWSIVWNWNKTSMRNTVHSEGDIKTENARSFWRRM
ncbi:uncharacterized protein LOC109830302 isoform X2 [Asparagus officinalis]|uniref:uncharacterized protein LOC109830302 isoform X2 n=1 Tax=Asparagus officinalis TaxID=4686 RepID=UPI00098E654B|nr:uncharacterized protein LOC109830302 isoform X2 [Asparagus officinalis]